MVADKGKKSKVGQGDDSDHIDGELVLFIEKLQGLQDELEKVNEEASDQVLEVEQKYNEIRTPVYYRRNEIIKTIPDFCSSHPALCDLLNEEDQKNFKENSYFEDTKLTKTITFFEEGTTRITGTAIKWKEGMGAANGINHDTKGNKCPLADQSFFSWFSGTQQKDLAEFTDDVAEIITEDLWPNPLKYFNNDADEEDSDGEDVEEENGDDEEEHDE